MIIISTTIVFVSIFNFYLKILSEFGLLEAFVISLFSLISIFLSFNFLFKTKFKSLNINQFLSILFIQIFILNILFANGTIGNPNNAIKDFIYQSNVKTIIKNNPIFLIGKLGDKNLNLFQFYIPNYSVIKTKEIPSKETIYGIVNDKDLIKISDSIRSKFINLKEYKDLNLIKIN